MHRLGLIAALCVVSACSPEPAEEMLQIYRIEDRERFLRILVEEEVPHSVNEYGQIYYPISYRSEIKKAQEKIWGPIDKSKKGMKVGINVAADVAAALSEARIPFEVKHQDDTSIFTWSSGVNDSAAKVVIDVLSESGT